MRHHVLDRRIECLSMMPWPETGAAEAMWVITVTAAEVVDAYCDRRCWTAAEGGILRRLGVHYPYPPGGEGLVGSCSRCGIPFLLTQPHGALAVLDEALDGSVQSPMTTVYHDVGLAHFCPDCEPAGQGDVEVETRSRGPEPAAP
jgi:hypothetical protein